MADWTNILMNKSYLGNTNNPLSWSNVVNSPEINNTSNTPTLDNVTPVYGIRNTANGWGAIEANKSFNNVKPFQLTINNETFGFDNAEDAVNFSKAKYYENTLNKENSMLGKIGQGAQIAKAGLDFLNGGFELYSNIANYSTIRNMNKAKLENARLQNQALKEDMQFRRDEIARLGKMRTNAKAQQNIGSINTRG